MRPKNELIFRAQNYTDFSVPFRIPWLSLDLRSDFDPEKRVHFSTAKSTPRPQFRPQFELRFRALGTTARFPRGVQILPQPAFEKTQALDLNAAGADAQSNVISSWRHWTNYELDILAYFLHRHFLSVQMAQYLKFWRLRNRYDSNRNYALCSDGSCFEPCFWCLFFDRKTKRSSDILRIGRWLIWVYQYWALLCLAPLK